MNEKERKFYRDLLEDTRNIYKDWVDGLQAKVRQLKKDKLRLAKKLNQLEANWDELKGWLKANDIHYAEAITFRETLNKMQELERGRE